MPMGVIEVDPRKANLGTLKLNARQTVKFTVYNKGTAPLKISKVYLQKSGTVQFDGKKNGDLIIDQGKNKQITASFDVKKTGRFLELVIFECDARNSSKKGYKTIMLGTVK